MSYGEVGTQITVGNDDIDDKFVILAKIFAKGNYCPSAFDEFAAHFAHSPDSYTGKSENSPIFAIRFRRFRRRSRTMGESALSSLFLTHAAALP